MTSHLMFAAVFARLAAVPLMDWLLWLGSLVLSVALVIVLRMQWGQSRPLQKCAVLSLLVHALLACLAMTVRVVVGEGGGGAGAPIRVRLVDDSIVDAGVAELPTSTPTEISAQALSDPLDVEPETATDAVETEPAMLAEPAPPHLPVTPSLVDDPVELPPPESDKPVDPGDAESIAENDTIEPMAVEGIQPIETTESVAAVEDRTFSDSTSEAMSTRPSPPSTEHASSSLSENVEASEEMVPSPIAAEPPTGSSPPTPGASAPYTLRGAPGRLGLVELQGGNAQTEAAVAAALSWLARSQSNDGRWDATRFGAGREQAVMGHDRGGAGQNADTGISALALLAFLGAGHSHEQGDYQSTVRRGVDFLIRSQAVDGNLFGQSTFYAQMYCHSMATFALAEAHAMTGDARLQPAVQKAIDFCLRAQNPATGGWRYRPTYDMGDTSQLGWQMMALASAQHAGIEVPMHTWTRVGRFLDSVRRGSHSGLASYRPDGPASTSMTAEALYCRLLLEDTGGAAVDERAAREATNQLLTTLPDARRVNLYYWYYATLALHRRHQAGDEAEAAWTQWNEALTTTLLETQVHGGPNEGSWNTNTVWGGYGGRVYTTSMAAMCLEVYYRYALPRTGNSIAIQPRTDDRVR
jgi:hypothetical protein